MHSRVYISQEWKGQSSQMRSLHSCIPNTCKLSFLRLTPTDAPFRDSNPKIDQNCWKQPSNRWSKPEPILRFVEGRDLEMEQFGPLPKWMSAPPDHHCALSAKPHRPPLPTPASSGEQRHRPLLASPVSLTLQTSSSARASSFEQPSYGEASGAGGGGGRASPPHTHREGGSREEWAPHPLQEVALHGRVCRSFADRHGRRPELAPIWMAWRSGRQRRTQCDVAVGRWRTRCKGSDSTSWKMKRRLEPGLHPSEPFSLCMTEWVE
jgi:hypothetical protein